MFPQIEQFTLLEQTESITSDGVEWHCDFPIY